MEALMRAVRTRDVACPAFFSIAFALSFGLGYRLDGMRWWDVIAYVCSYSLIFFVVVRGLMAFLRNRPLPLSFARAGGGRFWAVSFAVLLICYVLCLLMNWPGILTEDSLSSIRQALGLEEWSNWHPFAFTALVAPFVLAGSAWGDVAVGVGLYSAFQLTLCAAVLSYVCRWLHARGAKRAALAALAFFALNPIIARYSITMWKDIPFSMAMVLYVLALFDVVLAYRFSFDREGGEAETTAGCLSRSSGVILVASSLAVCLLRSNGIYVAIAVAAVLLALYWRRLSVWMRAGVAAAPIVALLVVTPLYGALGVKSAPFQETVGIPLQQLGAVAAEEGDMSEGSAASVGNVIPLDVLADVYDPDSVNLIKYDNSFKGDWLDAHKGEFFVAWLDVGFDNPVLYVRAWLEGTRGFWNVDDYGWMTSERGYRGEGGRNLLYEATGLAVFDAPNDDFDALRQSIFYPMFNIASWAWLVLFAIVCSVRFRAFRLALPMLPLALLWATMMVAAPVSWEPRYLFSLHILLPVVVVFVFWVAGGSTKERLSAPSL